MYSNLGSSFILHLLSILDDMHTVVVDVESEVPFGESILDNGGSLCFTILNSLDGLHSVKFDPPILDLSEKSICMQWASVFLSLLFFLYF